MGTRIEAAATSFRRGRLLGRGALHLSDAAATACLLRAHHRPEELDILINAGIYKDRNAAEPALASIIQEDIGANPGHPPRIGRHGTFSFDVINGGCGVVTAAQIVDGFVGHGGAQLGMIVAADAEPSRNATRGFKFSPAGGAMLISHADDGTGFERFELRTFSEDAALFQARVRWDPRAGFAHRGRNVVEISEAREFAARCVERATEVALDFLAQSELTPRDIDLLIASQYPRAFASQVARRLGIPANRLPRIDSQLAGSHTAGPIAALEAAIESGKLEAARNTLFVTAGAGLTIGIAHYRAGGRRAT